MDKLLDSKNSKPVKTNYMQNIGILFSFISACSFALYNFTIKLAYINSSINYYEMLYFRMLISSLYFLSFSLYQKIDIFHIRKESTMLIIIRIFTGFFGVLLQLYMYKILPLSIATIIFYIYPGVMSFICYLRLNERLSRYDYLSMIFSFMGLCIISFNREEVSLKYNLLNLFIPIASAILCGITDMCTKIIGNSYNFLISPTYFSLSCLFISPVFILFLSTNDFHSIYLSPGFFYCILASIWGTLGQTMVALALIYEKGGRFAVIQYLSVALSVLFDIIFLGKTLNIFEIMGMALIIGVNCIFSIFRTLKLIN